MVESRLSFRRHYCRECGSLLAEEGARFCDQCGSSLDQSGPAPLSVEFGPVVTQSGSIPNQIRGTFMDYLVLHEVGRGGMGTVFHVMHHRSGQAFALKLLEQKLTLQTAMLDAFMREAETQAEIVHPNVVRLFELAQHNGRLGLVLELVQGASLDIVLAERQDRGMRVGQALWLAGQMCLGLAVVHSHGYIHADIKPSNFLYGKTDFGETALKIADFGIARSLRSQLRGHSSRSGTPGYMSPEQIRGEPLSPASDMYSLGCVIFELFSGQPVFPLNDIDSVFDSHLHEKPNSLDNLCSDTPRELSKLIQTLLRKRPNRRPQSMEEVYNRLQEIRA